MVLRGPPGPQHQMTAAKVLGLVVWVATRLSASPMFRPRNDTNTLTSAGLLGFDCELDFTKEVAWNPGGTEHFPSLRELRVSIPRNPHTQNKTQTRIFQTAGSSNITEAMATHQILPIHKL